VRRISIKCNECFEDSDCNYNGQCKGSTKYSNEGRCKCFPNYFGVFCQYNQPCESIRTEKDPNTTLQLLKDTNDPQGEDFVEVYGRPMYVIRDLQGKPYSLLRLGYPNDGPQYFNITYPNDTTDGVVAHKHYHDSFFEDDDFFEVNNSTEDQELYKNYTFVVKFTGQRWYGQIVPPGLTEENFKEEEYHGMLTFYIQVVVFKHQTNPLAPNKAFWHNSFSGLGDQDNRTLLISAPAASKGSPVGSDFFEMRRRNIVFESGQFDYNYGPYGVLIPVSCEIKLCSLTFMEPV
jgi:hypothetical protein